MALACLAVLSSVSAFAQGSKTSKGDSEQQNSSIFLNAASDSKPRQVSLGLPTNATSAVQIYEDGLPVSYYIYHLYPYKSWHGGVSAKSTGSMGPMETAMRYGEINNYVDSYNRGGSDSFRGSYSYTIGQWGQHKMDINISGPLANGWGYSLSTYQNFDPGSNHSFQPMLKDRHQFYKGVISKEFASGKGSMSLVYQYVNYMSVQENYGPFVFVGDGSVKEYNGFSLGHDSYRPDFAVLDFMDIKTGMMESINLLDGNRDKSHHATFVLGYDFDNGMHFDFRSRYKGGKSVRGAGSLSGIENITSGSDYTYADGTPFTGYLQKRSVMHFDTFEYSWMNNAELSWNSDNHSFRAGADLMFNHGSTATSTVTFSHEVAPDPILIQRLGQSFYNYNSAGEYYDGHERKAALYIKDDWNVSDRMDLTAFIRAEYLGIFGDAANNIGDDKSNTRYPGYNLTKGKITKFQENYLNGAAGLSTTYRIVGGLAFQADGIFTRIHSNIFKYGGFYDPSTDPTDTKFAKAGLSYKNSWINVVSQLTYISQSNYNTRSVFQHTLQRESNGYPAGYIESVTLPATYGISSFGWTTDAMITSDGFTLHANLTLRDPQYRNFIFAPTFSDGVREEYDFSGNSVTNLHKVEITLDPSYSFDAWRFWLSTRYISKTYINKTNSLFFKGRVETFGGIDYKLTKACKLSLNVINILNQKGASGLISSADLVEDASSYKNFLMSGTFIRPFTMEFGVSIDF